VPRRHRLRKAVHELKRQLKKHKDLKIDPAVNDAILHSRFKLRLKITDDGKVELM
jgi:ribosomal protein L31E